MEEDKILKNPGGNPAAHRYPPAAWLRVTGDDALAFLQGQFTQELRSQAATPVAYGLWLNQKGRVLADSFALRVSPGEVWLLSYAVPAAAIRERLEAYIIADDVSVGDATDAWRGAAIVGAGAAEWLAGRVGALPAPGEFARVGDGFLFRGRRDGDESWEWLAPENGPDVSGLPELAAADLEYRRIASCIPAVPTDIGPADLPNEGGLDVEAISYTKGCYLGQEVMARLKSMGQVRRRLLRVAHADGGQPAPTPPALLFQAGKKVGELRSVAAAPEGVVVGLAMFTLLGLDARSPLALAPDGEAAFTLVDTP